MRSGFIKEQLDEKGHLCLDVSWFYCWAGANEGLIKKTTSIKTALPMQYANDSVKDGGQSERRPHGVCRPGPSLFMPGPLCSCSTDKSQERAPVEGHLCWRWGPALLHTAPLLWWHTRLTITQWPAPDAQSYALRSEAGLDTFFKFLLTLHTHLPTAFLCAFTRNLFATAFQ